MIDTDMNVQELALNSGISRVTMSSVKCGKSCSILTASKIAKALGCKVEDLIEGAATPVETK